MTNINCCCCNAHTGLRVLGWWWVIQCILVLWNIFTPILWVYTVVIEVTFIPCCVAFFMMGHKNDSAEGRERLYTFWKYIGCYFGLAAEFGIYIYFYFMFRYLIAWICEIVGLGSMCLDQNQSAGAGFLILGAINTALIAVFRIYFLSVMKRYWEEAKFGTDVPAGGVYVVQAQNSNVGVAYQQPGPGMQQPGMPMQQPGMPMQPAGYAPPAQPGVVYQQPGTSMQ